jgi:DnaK suppressor protein
MDEKTLQSLAHRLRQQRAAYLKEFTDAEEALRAAAEERESELEEQAQEARAASFFACRDDRVIRAVEEIDAALNRISAGNYGKCQRCGKGISLARLRALPAAALCLSCAGREERGASSRPPRETSSPGKSSGDLSLLSDRELEALVREQVKEDGRIDTEELRIACRRAVVYLYGALPSEAEHQILLDLVTDVLGLKEVVDRVQVDELLWEREDRSKPKAEAPVLPWEEPAATDDIVETNEEGKEFVAPDRPLPDRK